MSGTEIAAVIAATAGLLTAGLAGVRALRSDKIGEKANAAAAVLSGLQGLITTLQAEVNRLNSDIERHRIACNEERLAARREHLEEIRQLREEHREEMLIAYERIDELGTQVYVLQNRSIDSKDRSSDV